MALANRLACFVISSCSSRGYEANMSYFVPIRTGIAVCESAMTEDATGSLHHPSTTTLTLLNPLACLYHSFTEFKVLFLVKSNMNKIATASLLTRGSIDTNSRCPPRSQIYDCQSTFRHSLGTCLRPCGRVVSGRCACHNDAQSLPTAQTPRDDSPKM